MSRIQWTSIGHSELANGMDVFTTTGASAFRVLQDTCCPATWIVVSAENTFHIAVAAAVLQVEAGRMATEGKLSLTNNFFGALAL